MARSPNVDRAVRIELLRARAALEREALVISVVHAGESITPRALFAGVWPRVAAANSSRLAMQAFNVLRRYPVVGSCVSRLIFGGTKKTGLLKLAGGVLVGWRILSALRTSKENRVARENSRNAPHERRRS
jgi:hypothetical protein